MPEIYPMKMWVQEQKNFKQIILLQIKLMINVVGIMAFKLRVTFVNMIAGFL